MCYLILTFKREHLYKLKGLFNFKALIWRCYLEAYALFDDNKAHWSHMGLLRLYTVKYPADFHIAVFDRLKHNYTRRWLQYIKTIQVKPGQSPVVWGRGNVFLHNHWRYWWFLRPQTLKVISTGHRTSSWWEFVAGQGGLFVTLLPTLKEQQIRKSGVCWHGVVKKTKKRSLWRFTSNQSDRSAWKPAQRLMSGVVKSFKAANRSTHTAVRLCVCCLSDPRPRLSRDLNRSVCVRVNEQSPPIYYELWRTWRILKWYTRARRTDGVGYTAATSTIVSDTHLE